MHTTERTSRVALACRRGGSAGRTRDERAHGYYSVTSPNVKGERTHWRDAALSERHRLYGADCPAVDVDFLLVEFDCGRPCALVEYKSGDPRPLDFEHPSYRALRHLADASRIPAAVVFYSPSFWHFTGYPLNARAVEWFAEGEVLSELEYVTRLYRLRGRVVPAAVTCRLNQVKPEEVG